MTKADEMPRFRPWSVFTAGFWLNFAVSLLITLPVPVFAIYINGELARRVPLYENYLTLFKALADPDKGVNGHDVRAIALQWAMCLAVTYAVWFFMLRGRQRHEAPAPPA